jgi:hypothetical protein
MFQVVPEPEFAAWFESLPEPLAEEVATAIDLAANAGSLLAPERLSRLLLWFDGTGSGSGSELGAPGLALRGWPEQSTELARSYLAWHQEVRLCLESATFRERLARLEPKLATQALRQVERLKRLLHASRLASAHSPWAHSSAAGSARTDAAGLRGAFLELLGLIGLTPHAVLGSGSGLRELSIDNVQPQLRVLFGLDFPAKRLLAICGEPLDRRYYGDSVKHAEQRWQQYCDRTSTLRNDTP